ncbi:MAG: hypothetical protein LBM13_06005 [Candidatus Ancillula sp.]|jgi:hypothetical protein|nr:hypothetical protein [Candidatus Ancillula sp.]
MKTKSLKWLFYLSAILAGFDYDGTKIFFLDSSDIYDITNSFGFERSPISSIFGSILCVICIILAFFAIKINEEIKYIVAFSLMHIIGIFSTFIAGNDIHARSLSIAIVIASSQGIFALCLFLLARFNYTSYNIVEMLICFSSGDFISEVVLNIVDITFSQSIQVLVEGYSSMIFTIISFAMIILAYNAKEQLIFVKNKPIYGEKKFINDLSNKKRDYKVLIPILLLMILGYLIGNVDILNINSLSFMQNNISSVSFLCIQLTISIIYVAAAVVFQVIKKKNLIKVNVVSCIILLIIVLFYFFVFPYIINNGGLSKLILLPFVIMAYCFFSELTFWVSLFYFVARYVSRANRQIGLLFLLVAGFLGHLAKTIFFQFSESQVFSILAIVVSIILFILFEKMVKHNLVDEKTEKDLNYFDSHLFIEREIDD